LLNLRKCFRKRHIGNAVFGLIVEGKEEKEESKRVKEKTHTVDLLASQHQQ
jgi:ABC-type proline/glycine betaine transport system ATPase subunit